MRFVELELEAVEGGIPTVIVNLEHIVAAVPSKRTIFESDSPGVGAWGLSEKGFEAFKRAIGLEEESAEEHADHNGLELVKQAIAEAVMRDNWREEEAKQFAKNVAYTCRKLVERGEL
jgi:hypothetical protein